MSDLYCTIFRLRSITEQLVGEHDVGPRLNATDLAEQFGVSTKTIQRDIRTLRQLGFRIEYDQVHFTYYFAAPGRRLLLSPDWRGRPVSTDGVTL